MIRDEIKESSARDSLIAPTAIHLDVEQKPSLSFVLSRSLSRIVFLFILLLFSSHDIPSISKFPHSDLLFWLFLDSIEIL